MPQIRVSPSAHASLRARARAERRTLTAVLEPTLTPRQEEAGKDPADFGQSVLNVAGQGPDPGCRHETRQDGPGATTGHRLDRATAPNQMPPERT